MFRNPIAWLFVAIVLVLAAAVWNTTARLPRQPVSQTPPVTSLPVTKLPGQVSIFPTDPVRGETGASVTVVEFGDFECPYCAETAVTVEKVISQSGGKLKLVWKDFPLPSHSQAQAAAEAAQCAQRQGKFWEYHDALFSKQDSLNSTTYLSLAGELGLDFDNFSRCLSSHETLPLIERNLAEGTAIGVDGTPFFVINGQAVSGVLTEDQLRSLVE
ncbi:MAG: thioredoxin domain-containing protein [Candidatus Veblenbacteria bacterium]|nr:thioredoxin domain-containing protein [Candidatus Veblenbacteria bacterium]